MEENILISSILDTDSYKLSHWKQYPPNTTEMFSYLESRGGKYTHTMFFGLQYYLKKYLSKQITMEQVEEAKQFADMHGVPFNYEGFKYIVEEHDGYLPVKIRAVPEGMVVPVSNVLMSVESTDPKVFWIVSWLETALVRLWYPITVATQSRHIRKTILRYLEETAENPEAEINFKLHDFGSRGVSSQETAAIGGMSHLATGFQGSDTIAGIYAANKFYNEDMSGFSIPASEHSTMTMWGKENESKAYKNMIEVYKDTPGGLFACVSDSYDIYNAVENIFGDELKDDVLASEATLVIRPDSGDPVEVITKLCQLIEKKFGAPYNDKGYKVFNKVRLIQGDGVDPESIEEILSAMKALKFSASNIAFGSGGALLQKMNRDTQKFAFKCSCAKVDGKDVEVFKQPVTAKFKKSKKGKLDLVENIKGEVETTVPNDMNSLMVDVFENGKILKEYSLKEVRERAAKPCRKQKL